MRSFSLTIAALLLAAPSALAGRSGSAIVSNHCTASVVVSYVADEAASATAVAAGAAWSTPMVNKAGGGGPSVKLYNSSQGTWDGNTFQPTDENIMQFEYQNSELANFNALSYDISNVNCYTTDSSGKSCPFWQEGYILETSLSSEYTTSSDKDCAPVPCAPGVANCPSAYWYPNDNDLEDRTVQYSCSQEGEYNLVLHLCPCQGGSNDGACAAAKNDGASAGSSSVVVATPSSTTQVVWSTPTTPTTTTQAPWATPSTYTVDAWETMVVTETVTTPANAAKRTVAYTA